jgi:hypothetical protein
MDFVADEKTSQRDLVDVAVLGHHPAAPVTEPALVRRLLVPPDRRRAAQLRQLLHRRPVRVDLGIGSGIDSTCCNRACRNQRIAGLKQQVTKVDLDSRNLPQDQKAGVDAILLPSLLHLADLLRKVQTPPTSPCIFPACLPR